MMGRIEGAPKFNTYADEASPDRILILTPFSQIPYVTIFLWARDFIFQFLSIVFSHENTCKIQMQKMVPDFFEYFGHLQK